MLTSALLLIALASVVLLLLLVIKAKAHPFVALLIVSLLVAFAAGIPADKIITTIEKGMGGLLGHIASIIILGSMLGVLIEMSGGAESLAKTLTGVLGAKRTIAALTIVAFILGTPVFFEVGFIIIIPLIYGFSKVAHVSPLKFGLPMAGVMLTVHVALPTHPGAAAAAGILHSDVGWLMLAGIGVSVVVGIVGYFVARFINRRHYHLSINVLEQQQTAEVPDLSVNAQQTRSAAAECAGYRWADRGAHHADCFRDAVSGASAAGKRGSPADDRHWYPAGRPADLPGPGQLDAGHPSADEPEKAGRSHRQRDPLVGGRDPRRRRRRRLWRRTGRFRHR